MKDLVGKVTLITGAASGLGRLMAIRFGEAGAVLVLWDIQLEMLEETKALVLAAKADAVVHVFKCDLSQREEIYAVGEQVQETVGKVDILVNNAGIVSGRNFLACPDVLIERTMAVNIMAHMWLAKKFLPAMIEANSGTCDEERRASNGNVGHIVTISSASGTTGVPGLADYCASKWAATGFDEAIRMELKNEVCWRECRPFLVLTIAGSDGSKNHLY
jgi:all-trans-retinol dehydrogenase (NAD+)